MLGFALHEMPDDSAWWKCRIHPEDRPEALLACLVAAVENGASGCYSEYRVCHRDGRYIDLADAARFVRDDSGRVIRIVGGMRDITERRGLERERVAIRDREHATYVTAQVAARARDEMLLVISHDLRIPLNAIEVCASALLQDASPSAETTRKLLEAIQRSAQNTERLIRDLMDVSSIEAGHLALEPRDEPPGEIAEHAAHMFRPAARERGLLLETQIDRDLPLVRADPGRLLQALSNLITNALHFTGSGGCITLGVQPDARGVRFIVDDTGCGISVADLPHVFDRYWRKGGSERGVGLGLAIVRGIVQAHNGQVGVESVEGKGTRVAFTIPAADALVH